MIFDKAIQIVTKINFILSIISEMIVIQNEDSDSRIEEKNLQTILDSVLMKIDKSDYEVVFSFVSPEEIHQLNKDYRLQDKPTNVLSFENESPDEVDLKLLGDVIICTDIVESESIEQNKTFSDHLTHIAIHGLLHLIGYDHIDDKDAEIMEAFEVELLGSFGIRNPYL